MLVILPLSRVFTQTEILNATLICGVVAAITSSQPHFSRWSMLVTSTLRCTIFSTCWLWTLHICFSAGRLTCKFLFSWSLRRDLKKYPGKRQPRCAHSPGDVTELFVTLRASRKIPPPNAQRTFRAKLFADFSHAFAKVRKSRQAGGLFVVLGRRWSAAGYLSSRP